MNLRNLFCFLILIYIFNSCNLDQRGKKLTKSIKRYQYEYKMGEPSKIGSLQDEGKFNSLGNIIEKYEYKSDSSIYEKTIYRYNEKDQLIEESKYNKDKLIYKKILSYNEQNYKILVEIYKSEKISNRNDNQLAAALRIYYGKNNEVTEKKWIGFINMFEEETTNITQYDGTYDFSKTDTAFAKYYYTNNKKLSRIEIFGYNYFNLLNIDRPCLKYSYNKAGKILLIEEEYHYQYVDKEDEVESWILPNDDIIKHDKIVVRPKAKLTYLNDSIIQNVMDFNNIGNWASEYKYDKFGNAIEIITKCTTAPYESIDRYVQIYNENNDLIETIKYDKLNEPVELTKIIIEYW